MKTLFCEITAAVALLLVGCSQSSSQDLGSQSVTTTPTTAPTTTTPVPTDGTPIYSIQFEGFGDMGKYGVGVGDTTNLRFALELKETKKNYTSADISKLLGNDMEISSKIVVQYDKGAYCTGKTKASAGFADLPAGDPAWVDHLDVTMTSGLPAPADGGPPEEETSNRMCFGVRLGGVWQWHLAPQVATWDAAAQKYRIRFTIQQGPVDAIKILFNSSVVHRAIDKLELAAKPQTANP
jgi:hypothetical protein